MRFGVGMDSVAAAEEVGMQVVELGWVLHWDVAQL